MGATRRIALFAFAVLAWGFLTTSCTIVTDPTKSSSDFTSSTSPGSSKSKSDEKAKAFANENLARLKEDMALGRGEYLTSLATLLEIPEDRRTQFFTLAKEKFPTLVSSEWTTSDELLAALDHELMMHPYLRGDVTPN